MDWFCADNYAAQPIAMAVQEFGGGMHDHIRAKLQWPLKVRRHESVVHGQLSSTAMGNARYFANVGQYHERVGWRFHPDNAGIPAHGFLYCIQIRGVDVAELHAVVRHYLIEEPRHSAIHVMSANQVIALLQKAL